ncbi:MAG TPA: peptide-methionine (R)-S-oxide reductase MsrB [Rhodothermales bacterium]|nr:peptide-methionine (R)-S-oxide reductase MsrB [Rhodothermales bacterium]
MNRRSFLTYLPGLLAVPTLVSACGQGQSQSAQEADSGRAVPDDSLRIHSAIGDFEVLNKPAEAWRGVVSEEAYQILFEDGTEPRYSSDLLKIKARGTYICAACYLPLFPSTTKYESGTGWPSFWAPLEGNLGEEMDRSLGMARTEYHCKRCGGHQGHIFNDGPNPTGLRYCNNGLALRFIPEVDPLPDLRS